MQKKQARQLPLSHLTPAWSPISMFALGYYNTGAFVPADEREFGWKRPVTHHGVEIGVADARVLDVDEDFIRARFLDRDFLVANRCNISVRIRGHCHLRLFYRGVAYGHQVSRRPEPIARLEFQSGPF